MQVVVSGHLQGVDGAGASCSLWRNDDHGLSTRIVVIPRFLHCLYIATFVRNLVLFILWPASIADLEVIA